MPAAPPLISVRCNTRVPEVTFNAAAVAGLLLLLITAHGYDWPRPPFCSSHGQNIISIGRYISCEALAEGSMLKLAVACQRGCPSDRHPSPSQGIAVHAMPQFVPGPWQHPRHIWRPRAGIHMYRYSSPRTTIVLFSEEGVGHQLATLRDSFAGAVPPLQILLQQL